MERALEVIEAVLDPIPAYNLRKLIQDNAFTEIGDALQRINTSESELVVIKGLMTLFLQERLLNSACPAEELEIIFELARSVNIQLRKLSINLISDRLSVLLIELPSLGVTTICDLLWQRKTFKDILRDIAVGGEENGVAHDANHNSSISLASGSGKEVC